MAAFDGNITLLQAETIHDQLDECFYQNLYILSLKYPMKKELKIFMKKGLLKTPNSQAFYQVAFYLMSIIDRTYITPDLEYVFTDPRMSVQFRNKFLTFVVDTGKKYEGYITPIMASWLVTAGGHKLILLMFQLSQVALAQHINKNKKFKDRMIDVRQATAEKINISVSDSQTEFHKAIYTGYNRTENMDKIGDIYKTLINDIEIDIDRKKAVLKNVIQNLLEKNNTPDLEPSLKELSDVMYPSSLLQDWDNQIKHKTEDVETVWNNSSRNILNLLQTLKSTCAEVIQLYTKRSYKDNTVEYDPVHDGITVDVQKNHIFDVDTIKSTVRENVLNLPNLFKAYNTMLKHCMKIIQSFNLNENRHYTLNDEKEKLNNIKMLLTKIENLTISIAENLKINNGAEEQFSNDSDSDYKWILEAVKKPSDCNLMN